MTFSVSGGIEWELDNVRDVLTIRPAESPASGYAKGQMPNYEKYKAPWGHLVGGDVRLVLEDGLTVIGGYAFYDCRGLTGSLSIPATEYCAIGEGAFIYCENLTGTLVLGEGVGWIGRSAFDYCNRLAGVKFLGGSKPSISAYAFRFNGNSKTARTYEAYGTWVDPVSFPASYASTRWDYCTVPRHALDIKDDDGGWLTGGMPYTNVNGTWVEGYPRIKDGGWI